MDEEELILRMVTMGFDEAVAAIGTLTDSVDGLTERMDAASASVGSKSGKKGLLGHLTSLNALIAGFGIYKAVTAFSSFQSQMVKLRTQTGATANEVKRMTGGILGMAVAVGTGPQSLAQALYHIESAGYRGKTALDALRIAAEGAQVGGANLTDTTTALTAVLVAGFGKGKNAAAQLKSAMGQLNATVGAGDMTFQDLNEALGTGILSTFATLGLKVKDLGAGLAVLGDNNIRGAAAATRLRMGLMALVKPSSTAADAMAAIHLGTYQLAEDLRKPNGLLVMLTDLKQHMDGLTKTQKAATLASIFGGGRNSAAMLTLINQMGRLKSKYDDINKSGNDFGQEWQQTTKTLSFAIDQLKTLGEVILVKVGGALAPVVKLLAGFVRGLQQGKPWAQAIAVALLAVAAGFTAAKIAAIEWDAALEFNPVVAVLTLIGLGILLVIKHFKTVKKVAVEVAKDIWHWLVGAFHAVEHVLDDVWKIVQKVFNFIIGKGGTVSKIFSFLNPVGQAAHVFNAGKSIVGSILGAFASGTDYVPASGSYLVGEQGPEIVNLQRGSQVIPNNEIGSGQGDGEYVLQATIVNVMDGKPVSRSVIRQGLMASARRGGGAPTLAVAGA